MPFKQTKLTVQLILGCVSILTGIVLLFFGIFLPPLGTISSSVIISFCELGTIGAALIGIDYKYHFKVFETEELGVRAHIQHLQAYGTKEETQLNGELVDPRYNWVHKTKFVEDIWGLAGTWATDPLYGSKLNDILSRMEEME